MKIMLKNCMEKNVTKLDGLSQITLLVRPKTSLYEKKKLNKQKNQRNFTVEIKS